MPGFIIQLFMNCHLRSGPYKNIVFHTPEKQYEPFIELISQQSSIQTQTAGLNNTRINILMTGAGAPGAPGIIHCLLQEPSFTVIAADKDSQATGRYLTHDFVQIPEAGDPDFIHTVLQVCRDKNIDIILPLVTRELSRLASSKKAFEKE